MLNRKSKSLSLMKTIRKVSWPPIEVDPLNWFSRNGIKLSRNTRTYLRLRISCWSLTLLPKMALPDHLRREIFIMFPSLTLRWTP